MTRRIGVLTSSRADFGIYLPLLKRLAEDSSFNLEIIAFGTHLSGAYGYTLADIERHGFVIPHRIESMPESDTEYAIATSIGLTVTMFSKFWDGHRRHFDLVFCLGDRFEMFAAVMAGVPFQIKFAHIHGGETTLGAIDNIFRHAISHASTIHFTSTESYKTRVLQLVDNNTRVYNTGALSLDNIGNIPLLSISEFKSKWGVDLSLPTVLMTFHPETVRSGRNAYFSREVVKVVQTLNRYQFLITMPNADTAGNTIREAFERNLSGQDGIYLVENLGTQSYFTAMKYCSFMLGNTSSGIIEAASFGKYVINLGDRQSGRICGDNVFHSAINFADMMVTIDKVPDQEYTGPNIYYQSGASNNIISILKQDFFYD